MAGRGRGRGRGSNTIAITDALGVGRGEISAVSVHQPPPLFPTLEFKPLPFLSSSDDKELIKMKQAFRQAARAQPYFLRKATTKKEIDRYTDRYLGKDQTQDDSIPWTPQWSKLPAELKLRVQVPGKRVGRTFLPQLGASRKRKKLVDVTKTLEMLEAEEKTENTEEQDEENEEEEEDEGEIYDEEQEEGTDYNLTYFDNGEEYAQDDDDALEGEATY